LKDFILNHKRLVIGIVLYIAVFIVSGYISPWQVRDITLDDFEVTESNIILEKAPVKIIYFGIYELCELLVYADEKSGFMFFITACAFFTYAYFIKKLFIREEYPDSIAEKITLDFIYDNIFAYIISLLVYYLYKPVSGKIGDFIQSDSFWLKSALILALIIFIILPAIPQVLQVFAYVYAILGIVDLLNHIDSSLDWNIILKSILMFVVASVIIVLLNIIINILLEGLQKWIGGILLGVFPVMGVIAVTAVKFCIKAILFISLLMLVVWLITKFL